MVSPPIRRPRLVVIEDDPAVRDSLRFTLDLQGYDVRDFDDGASAIADSDILAADGLLIDYALPDMNGVAVLEALQRRGSRCPVIIIASDASAHCRQRAEQAGARFIEKSLMAEALNALVRDTFPTPEA
jgi:DNA-binding NtrC family response regulator